MHVPTDIIGLDWETYFCSKTYTLKKMTTTAYIRDSRFKTHGAAVRTNKEKKARWLTGAALGKYLHSVDWSKTAFLGHHSHFDALILTHHLHVYPTYYYDTMSMYRALYGTETRVGLDVVLKHLGLGAKHETYLDNVDGVRDPTPKDLKTLGDGAIIDCDGMWAAFRLMLKDFPETELDLVHHTVRCYVEPVLQVNKEKALKAHAKVIRDRRKLLRRVAQAPRLTKQVEAALLTSLRSRKKFPEMLIEAGVTPPLKISPTWMKKPKEERDPEKKYTYAFAGNDLSFLELLEHPVERVRNLVEAKLLCGSSIHETRPMRMLEHGTPALTIYLNYWGARTTGRWSGGDKMNPQNFSRDGELRNAIEPPKGHVLVVVDSGQIEARTNAYLAGQWNLIEQFREYDRGNKDADPYCMFASSVFGHKVTKENNKERFLGKVSILGLGYQMSWQKFQFTLESGGMGPRVVLDLPMYKTLVDTYRSTMKSIVAQWYEFNDRLHRMMTPGYMEGYRNDILTFRYQALDTPCGIPLKYPNLRMSRQLMDVLEDGTEIERDQLVYGPGAGAKIYGGKLVENVIQHLARQIVAEQILRVADRYRVVMMTHDEAVLCVPKRQAKKALAETIEAFSTPSDWCKDLPVTGEGGIFEHYVKM